LVFAVLASSVFAGAGAGAGFGAGATTDAAGVGAGLSSTELQAIATTVANEAATGQENFFTNLFIIVLLEASTVPSTLRFHRPMELKNFSEFKPYLSLTCQDNRQIP
jgi:hypothetical protein